MIYDVPQLLDRVIEQIGVKNDLALARKLGLSTGHISLWRSGKRSPDPDRLAQLYELAGLDPTPALLAKHAELSKGPARKYYERLLRSVAALGLALIIVPPAHAEQSQNIRSNFSHTYTLCDLWRWLLGRSSPRPA